MSLPAVPLAEKPSVLKKATIPRRAQDPGIGEKGFWVAARRLGGAVG
jgi:hypothetical protein